MSDNWSKREFVIGRKSPDVYLMEYVRSYQIETYEPMEMTRSFSIAYGFDSPFDAVKVMSRMTQYGTSASWFVFKRTMVKEKVIGKEALEMFDYVYCVMDDGYPAKPCACFTDKDTALVLVSSLLAIGRKDAESHILKVPMFV